MGLVPRLHRGVEHTRRQMVVARIRTAARLAGADLDLAVDPTASFGRVDVRFGSDAPVTLHVGPHSVLDDDVEIRIDGGSVRIGDWCELRRGVRLMVGGAFELEGQNLLSWGTVVHCAEAVSLRRQATVGEYATIADSAHRHVAGAWHVDHVHTAPVVVGRDTWIGAKATLTSGVTVGDGCVVAGSAVVTTDVPDHHVAMGIPAVHRPRRD